MTNLTFRERPAAGDPAGLLVLHHGRGADEHDLLGLGDVLDPRAPAARRHAAGAADAAGLARATTGTSCRASAIPTPTPSTPPTPRSPSFHDELWERTGIGPERTVLGGFSMGSVMSYALGLGPDRPAPAGILAFSGFVPTVDGWEPDLASRTGAARVHRPRPQRPGHGGRLRPHARATCSRAAASTVDYHESDAGAPHRPGPRRPGHPMAGSDLRAGVIGLGTPHSPTEGGARMADSVYRVTEVIGVSSESWEAAARNAVDTAAKSVRDLRIAEVVRQDVTVADGGVVNFRVRLAISFKSSRASSPRQGEPNVEPASAPAGALDRCRGARPRGAGPSPMGGGRSCRTARAASP